MSHARWMRLTLLIAALCAVTACTSIEFGFGDGYREGDPRFISDDWRAVEDNGIGPPPCHSASTHPNMGRDRC